MEKTVKVKGRLTGPRSVELDQPVKSVASEVDVLIRPLAARNGETLSQYLRKLPAGSRSKEDIDKQVQDERGSWGDR